MSDLQLFPELAASEYEALKADIAARGVLVPVLYDQDGNLLDGHHRQRIAEELGLAVPTWEVEAKTDGERRAIVRAVNLYRRHLTPEQRAEHIAALRGEGWSLRAIGKVAGVSPQTVMRDMATVPDGTVPERIVGLDGKSRPSTRPAADRLAPLMSSESAEWYTPSHVIAAVVESLGGIDLDPCAEPAKAVPATHHLTIEEDGLAHGWRGKVYMNPPYGGGIADWTDKLAEEYLHRNVEAAVALVPARVETAWYQNFPTVAACHITGRLRFSGSENSAPFPSAALYVGASPERFAAVFRQLGDVWKRWE